MTTDRRDTSPARQPTMISVPVCVGIGVVAALLGLTPWVLPSAQPPPAAAYLWTADTTVVLLPFTRYSAALLPGLVVTGYGFAGFLARALRTRLPRQRARVVAISSSAVFLVAAVQTVLFVAGLADLSELIGPGARIDRPLRIPLLLGVVAGAVLLGVAVFRLLRATSRPVAVVGVTLAAMAFAAWFSALVLPVIVPANEVASAEEVQLLRTLSVVTDVGPAVLTGAGIAWAGMRTRGWFPATIASLALLCFLPPLPEAVTFHLARGPVVGESFTSVLLGVLLTWEQVFVVVVAAVVAGVGLGLRALWSRRIAREAQNAS